MTVLKDTQQLVEKLKVAFAYPDARSSYQIMVLTLGVLCLPQNAVKKNDLATGKTVLGQIKVSSSTGSVAGSSHLLDCYFKPNPKYIVYCRSS
jgi:hypothetical protein